MIIARVFALTAWLVAAPPAVAATVDVVVVVDQGRTDAGAAFRQPGLSPAGDVRVSVLEMDADLETDPMLRGRLLARLVRADLIVPVGERATGFVLAEREDVPVFFVGAASLVSGRAVRAPDVGGILPYNVAHSLDAIQALGLAPLGLAYTSGYEAIAGAVETAARARGLEILRRPVEVRREIGPAVRDLMRRARAVWVLGDPLLTRDAGLTFLVEQSLAARVPVIAPGRFELERGALLATEPAWEALAGQAVERLKVLLASDRRGGGLVVEGPAGGRVLFNRTLAEKWHLGAEPGWRGVP